MATNVVELEVHLLVPEKAKGTCFTCLRREAAHKSFRGYVC